MSGQPTTRKRSNRAPVSNGPGRLAIAADPTREKLIETAGRVFASRGYQSATIREISKLAKANVAAVNYHFGDKLGLYAEVLSRSMRAAHIEEMRNALDQNAPPEEILRAVIRARLRGHFRGDLPDWHFQIMFRELAQPTPAFPRLLNKVGRPIFHRMLDLVGGMMGLPPTEEKTRLCAVSIMGQIIVYVLAAPVISGVWPDLKMTPEQIDRIADHIADFSLSYIRDFRALHGGVAAAGKPVPQTNSASEAQQMRFRK